MKELLAFHLSQWIFEPRHIRASKTLKPQTASAQLETASKTSKNAENMVDPPKCINMISDTRIKGKNIRENLHAPSIMLYFGFQLGICRLAFQVRKKRWKCMKYASTLLFPKGSRKLDLFILSTYSYVPLQSEDGATGNKNNPAKKVTRTFSMEAKKCMPRKGKAFGKPSGTLHALEFCMLSQAPFLIILKQLEPFYSDSFHPRLVRLALPRWFVSVLGASMLLGS